MPSLAVDIRSLSRSYGTLSVLSHLNLSVPRGCIFGLLGASGCGKTTLLKTLLGRLRPHEGEVIVLGVIPGASAARSKTKRRRTEGNDEEEIERGSELNEVSEEASEEVPGRSVGYMPQELALYDEFTLSQHLQFYGRLVGMTSAAIKQRELFLVDFLSLPRTKRKVSKLSGGQQRRVSLACALLASPPLLLLDEPTVGVDGVLRERIWKHLRSLSAGGTTILLTTHYIEEARQADIVGFMRSGRVLLQDKPSSIIQRFGTQTLEEAFLQVCFQDEKKSNGDEEDGDAEDNSRPPGREVEEKSESFSFSPRASSSSNDNFRFTASSRHRNDQSSVHSLNQTLLDLPDGDVIHHKISGTPSRWSYCMPNCSSDALIKMWPRWSFLYACTWRNILRFLNNVPALLFVFLLPSIQIALFCTAIGRDPNMLPFGLVNFDTTSPCYRTNTTSICQWNATSTDIIVHELYQTNLKVTEYSNDAEARRAAENNEIWGFLIIPQNYSTNFASDGICFSPSTFDAQKCVLRYALDESDVQTSQFAKKSISDALTASVLDIFPNATRDSPVQSLNPIYGSNSYSFTDFIAPGMIVIISFSQSIGLTALVFVIDEKSGVSERAFTAGLRASELMVSHAITQLIILSVQITLLLLFGLVIFSLPLVGSVILVFLICMMLAFCGVLWGLAIASVCREERQAMQLALGSFFPSLLLSGVIWPYEAIPVPLRYLSLILPTTWAAKAGRDVMSRGWGFEHAEVWQAFVVIFIWNTLLFLFSVFRLKTQK